MAASLPVEIVDTIVGCTYYTNSIIDKNTLSSIALLCRSWSASAQRLLFKRVLIRYVRDYNSFLEATNLATHRGSTLGSYVRVLEVLAGDKAGSTTITDTDLVTLISHTPRLYELVLSVVNIHQLSEESVRRLRGLATRSPRYTSSMQGSAPMRVRSLALVSCGVQSPILYQLLSIWPTIEFLYIGVEIAAPPPKWNAEFKLYELTLMRTPRPYVMSWLLSSSMDTLRIASFRDAPGRDHDQLLEQLGLHLRSLRLMNYSLRAAAVIRRCPNLEEFVLIQLSTLIKLTDLPPTVEHLSCRNLPGEDQALDNVIDILGGLPKLRTITCNIQAKMDWRFQTLASICSSREIELRLDESPPWMVSMFCMFLTLS